MEIIGCPVFILLTVLPLPQSLNSINPETLPTMAKVCPPSVLNSMILIGLWVDLAFHFDFFDS